MLTLKIVNSGSAFESPREEVARILRALADKIENGSSPSVVMDLNGNKCGTVEISDELHLS